MRRKFVVTYENSETFKADKYDQRKVSKESNFIWHPMTTVLREESVSEVHISEVTLQDKYYRAGSLTEEKSRMVHTVRIGNRPAEFNNLY